MIRPEFKCFTGSNTYDFPGKKWKFILFLLNIEPLSAMLAGHEDIIVEYMPSCPVLRKIKYTVNKVTFF